MRPKNLYKRNSIVISDDQVVKTVWMPFAWLANRCSQHEANALRKLDDFGFANAPKLLRQHDNVIAMTRIHGSGVGPRHEGDKALFLSIVRCTGALHAAGFAHGNITRKNILVNAAGEVFLIDFETCCSKSSLAFRFFRLWDYVRLYRLSFQIFHLDKHEIRQAFPGDALVAVRLVRPFYQLAHLAKKLKRRVLGPAASATIRQRLP